MPRKQYDKYKPGSVISAGDMNDRFKAAEWFSRLQVAPPLELHAGPDGPVLRLVDDEEFWIRIDGGTNPYSWTRMIPSGTGTFTASSQAGTTSVYPAYETNGVTSVTVGKIVLARKAGTKAYQLRFTS